MTDATGHGETAQAGRTGDVDRLLGLTDGFTPKFLRRYGTMAEDVRDAVRRFGADVRGRSYPDDDHSF